MIIFYSELWATQRPKWRSDKTHRCVTLRRNSWFHPSRRIPPLLMTSTTWTGATDCYTQKKERRERKKQKRKEIKFDWTTRPARTVQDDINRLGCDLKERPQQRWITRQSLFDSKMTEKSCKLTIRAHNDVKVPRHDSKRPLYWQKNMGQRLVLFKMTINDKCNTGSRR